MDIGRITFNNSPSVNIPPYGKVGTLKMVWLFELGKFYEEATTKKLYREKESALIAVPTNYTFVDFLSNSTTKYYEDAALRKWVRISEMEIED